MKLTISEQIKGLIPPLTVEEYQQLEANLKADGCRDALVVWADGDVLLDGHNRYEICQRLGLAFKTVAIECGDLEAACDWVDANQLGRRNLKPDQFTLVLGRRYNRAKKKQGGTGANQHKQTGQNGTSAGTAKRLGKQHGVGARTVKRAGQFAAAVEKAKGIEPGIEGRVNAGTAPPRAAVIKAAKILDKEPERAKAIMNAPAREVTFTKAHVAANSGENEWYTPKAFIEAARSFLGVIDLDPASSVAANEVVKAGTFFTKEDDGLKKKWVGRAWMNPPYSGDLIDKFTGKMVKEFTAGSVKEAVVLVNNATETKWFQELAGVASAICFPKSRVRFWSPGKDKAAPLQGQAVIYLGNRPKKFLEWFGQFGAVFYGIS